MDVVELYSCLLLKYQILRKIFNEHKEDSDTKIKLKKMMKKIFAATMVALSLNFFAQSQKKEVLPTKTQFDAKHTKDLLALGTATIEGIAVAREYTDANSRKNVLNAIVGADVTGTKHYAPEGTIVMLFPVTDYFKEYLKLRERYKQSRKFTPVLSPEAFAHRLEAKVGRNGAFTFNQMKPGKYYMETYFQYVGTGLAHEQVGRTDYYNGWGAYTGSSPIMQGYNYNYLDAKVETAMVTIKKDGEVLKVKL